MNRDAVVPALAGALFLCACLPGDTRPAPGRLFLTAEPGAATTAGVTTEDGWTIHFERLLVGLDGSLEGEACNDYGSGRYDRLFDFTVPGSQKVCELYGLGACDIQIRMRTPSTDTLLEKGVTSSDVTFMRTPDEDAPLPIPPAIGNFGTSVYARGRATKGGEVKHFEWKFHDRISLSDCGIGSDAPLTSAVNLRGGDDAQPAITIHGEELFRASAEDGSALRFDLLADADTDGDGNITMAELRDVPAPVGEMDGGALSESTLAAYLGERSLPRMVYLDQGPCKAIVRRNR